MSFHLIIVRHGNTFDRGDTVTRVGGRTDLPLSQSGLAQAEALGQHLEGLNFTRAFSSPLQRTRSTAEIILGLNRHKGTELVEESFLKEIDYGPDENKAEEVVVDRIGQDALEKWDRGGVMPEAWSPRPEKIRQDWEKWLQQLRGHASTGDRYLILTSNGIARFALDVLDLAQRPENIKLKTGAFGHFRLLKHQKTEVIAWNQRPA